jgi:hypothetical protein
MIDRFALSRMGRAGVADKPERHERMSELFSHKGLFSHLIKQRWALVETGRVFSDKYHNGKLDKLKQDAFYVDFRGGRIKSPDRIQPRTAYHQIKRTLDVLISTGDLPFRKAFETSNVSTRRMAASYVNKARAGLAELKSPKARKPATKPEDKSK